MNGIYQVSNFNSPTPDHEYTRLPLPEGVDYRDGELSAWIPDAFHPGHVWLATPRDTYYLRIEAGRLVLEYNLKDRYRITTEKPDGIYSLDELPDDVPPDLIV